MNRLEDEEKLKFLLNQDHTPPLLADLDNVAKSILHFTPSDKKLGANYFHEHMGRSANTSMNEKLNSNSSTNILNSIWKRTSLDNVSLKYLPTKNKKLHSRNIQLAFDGSDGIANPSCQIFYREKLNKWPQTLIYGSDDATVNNVEGKTAEGEDTTYSQYTAIDKGIHTLLNSQLKSNLTLYTDSVNYLMEYFPNPFYFKFNGEFSRDSMSDITSHYYESVIGIRTKSFSAELLADCSEKKNIQVLRRFWSSKNCYVDAGFDVGLQGQIPSNASAGIGVTYTQKNGKKSKAVMSVNVLGYSIFSFAHQISKNYGITAASQFRYFSTKGKSGCCVGMEWSSETALKKQEIENWCPILKDVTTKVRIDTERGIAIMAEKKNITPNLNLGIIAHYDASIYGNVPHQEKKLKFTLSADIKI